MRKLLILFVPVLLACLPALAQSGGCSTASCTASVSSPAAFLAGLPSPSNANAAVTVTVSGGSAGWTSGINYTVPSAVTNLTIQGSTAVSCTGTAGTSSYTCAAADNTTILDNYNSNTSLLVFMTGGSSSLLRITGLSVLGGTANADKYNGVLNFSGNGQVRIDHSHFNVGNYSTSVGGTVMRFQGQNTGVADHNLIEMGIGTSNNGIQAFNAIGDSIGNGDGTFQNATPWGTANFIFMENNQFNGGYSNDCANAGLFVERYNTFTNMTVAVQTHGTKSPAGSGRGCRAYEFYKNYIAAWGTEEDAMTGTKGTTSLNWGNTMQSGTAYRYWAGGTDRQSGDEVETNTPNGWGYCGTSVNGNGTGSGWDGNSPSGFAPASSLGYPCLDGAGRGQTMQALNGANFPSRLNSVASSIAWPHQYLEPVYLWQNSIGGATEYSIRDTSTTLNTDLFIDNPSFNGTTGTGYGLLSARPSTCTPGPGGTYYTSPTGSYGVAYFATDANGGRGELYVCTALNTWTGIYEPYTYPHPLDASSTVVLSPANENFGSVALGSSSSPVTLTLTNSSGVTATGISPTITGGNTGDFSVINTGAGSCGAAGGSLATGNSCTFTVTFTPQATGSRSSTVSVSYSGGDGLSPQASALSGTGTTTGAVTLTPSSNAFGSVIVGIASSAATFTLSNTSGVTVTSIAVTFTGTNSTDFSRTGGTCGTTLANGASCTIFVEFTPGATGSRSGILTVADSDSSSPQTATLTGTGINGTVTISPSSQNFGSQPVGIPSSPVTFTLTNTNATAITGITISFVGGNNSDFYPSGGTCGSSIPGNSSCTIILVFQPSAAAARSTALNVADSASSSPQQSSLTGTGGAAVFTSGPSAFPM